MSAADRDGTCGLRDRPVPLVLPDQSTTACLAFRRWTCAARAGRAQGADGWRSELRVCALGCSMGPMVTHPENVTSPFRSEAGCADPIDGLSASTVETEGPTPWLRSSEPPRGRLALTGSLDRGFETASESWILAGAPHHTVLPGGEHRDAPGLRRDGRYRAARHRLIHHRAGLPGPDPLEPGVLPTGARVSD